MESSELIESHRVVPISWTSGELCILFACTAYGSGDVIIARVIVAAAAAHTKCIAV